MGTRKCHERSGRTVETKSVDTACVRVISADLPFSGFQQWHHSASRSDKNDVSFANSECNLHGNRAAYTC
ncbi:hypothetical protein D3C74_400200 [compost metagenome]